MPKLGFITPSQFSKIIDEGRGVPFKTTAYEYAEEVAMGIVFGIMPDEIKAASLSHGNENEDFAVAAYELEHLVTVERPGFQVLNRIVGLDGKPYIGGTPDGHVGEDLGVDTKCPFKMLNHYKNIKNGYQLETYKAQFQGYMWITGRKEWRLVSYNPAYPEYARLSWDVMERDEEYIARLEERITRFYWTLVVPEVLQMKEVVFKRWGVKL